MYKTFIAPIQKVTLMIVVIMEIVTTSLLLVTAKAKTTMPTNKTALSPSLALYPNLVTQDIFLTTKGSMFMMTRIGVKLMSFKECVLSPLQAKSSLVHDQDPVNELKPAD